MRDVRAKMEHEHVFEPEHHEHELMDPNIGTQHYFDIPMDGVYSSTMDFGNLFDLLDSQVVAFIVCLVI